MARLRLAIAGSVMLPPVQGTTAFFLKASLGDPYDVDRLCRRRRQSGNLSKPRTPPQRQELATLFVLTPEDKGFHFTSTGVGWCVQSCHQRSQMTVVVSAMVAGDVNNKILMEYSHVKPTMVSR